MSVTAAAGFVASGVHAGIRRSGLDLALVRSTVPPSEPQSGRRTALLAAPVVVSQRTSEEAEPQAVVVNAGVANAATGSAGIADAERTSEEVAATLGLDRTRSSCSRPA
jgi:glutamate N-acetyltransferase/amino-acid N-acetyltransferase